MKWMNSYLNSTHHLQLALVETENPSVQKPDTRKMNEFLKETVFFFIFGLVSYFLFLNFERREFYVSLITGNTK